MAALQLFSAAILLCTFYAAGTFVDDQERLRLMLFANYSVNTRPHPTTNVTVTPIITQLRYIDMSEESFSIGLRFYFAWTDPRLVWAQADYGDVKTVVIAPEHVWTPPILVQNLRQKVGVLGGQKRDGVPLRVASNGQVTWALPGIYRAACRITIAAFPLETQVCSLVIGPSGHPADELRLDVTEILTVDFDTNGEFELRGVNHSAAYAAIPHDDSDGNDSLYRNVFITFTFRRRWHFWIGSMLMPLMLNSVMLNAVFALPIESGEKMGYSLTVLLSYTYFLTRFADILPPISTEVSVVQTYLTVVLHLGTLSTLLTTWLWSLHSQPADKPVPPLLRKVALSFLVPFRGITQCRFWQGTRFASKAEGKPSELPTKPQQQSDNDPNFNVDAKKSSCMDDIHSPAVPVTDKNKAAERTTTTVTWQELSTLFNHFFLYTFGFVSICLASSVSIVLHNA